MVVQLTRKDGARAPEGLIDPQLNHAERSRQNGCRAAHRRHRFPSDALRHACVGPVCNDGADPHRAAPEEECRAQDAADRLADFSQAGGSHYPEETPA